MNIRVMKPNLLFKYISYFILLLLFMLNRKMDTFSNDVKFNSDDIKKIICPFCGRNFDKTNKPYILKCGHNICHRCLKLNVSNLLCIKCKYNCSQRELSKFPINFLLADIIDKLENSSGECKKRSKKSEKEEDLFYCNHCKLVITNKLFHEKSFQDHDLIDYKKYVSSRTETYKVKEKVLMDKFKETKDNYIQIHKDYFSVIIKNIFLQLDELAKSIESSDFLDNLCALGIISAQEKSNLTNFSKNYPKDFLYSVLKETKIDHIYNLEVKINKNNEIIKLENEDKKNYINKFFSEINNIEQTIKKLSKLDHNLDDIDKKIANLDIKDLTKNIFEDIIIQTNHLLNINFKKKDFISFAFFLTANSNFIIFNPITLELETYNLNKIKDIEIILLEGSSVILDDQKQLYISGGINKNKVVSNDLWKIILSSLEATKLLPMNEGRCYHHSFIRENKFFAIMGKTYNSETNSFETLQSCEKFDVFMNEWNKLPSFPKTVKGIKSFFCSQNYNFGIDNFKKIFYLNDKNKWKECKVTFKDPVDVDLRNFIIIPKDDNIFFIGGIDNKNEISDKIYRFSAEDEEFSMLKNSFCKKIKFENNNYSNFNNNYYLVEISKNEMIRNDYLINIYKTSNLKDGIFNLDKNFSFIDNN